MDRRVAAALVCALLLPAVACNRPAAGPSQPVQPGASLGAGPDAATTGGGVLPSGAIVAFAGQVPAG